MNRHHHHRLRLRLIFHFLFSLIIPHSISSFSATAAVAAAPTLTVTPTTLTRSGDAVTITWSGVASPSELDWLGIYSPPDSSHNDFIGYKFLSQSAPDTWQSGYGSVSIPLTNLRSEYSFRIFRWTRSEINPKKHDHDQNPLPGTAHLLAGSGRVRFGPGQGPEQVHLAYTDNEEEMRVMFVSGDGEEREVRWGERDGVWSHAASAGVGRYEREDMCDAPANESVGWRDPGWIHDAVMTGLKKGAKYYYQVPFISSVSGSS